MPADAHVSLWSCDDAEELGIDTWDICVGGDSTGSTLPSMVQWTDCMRRMIER